MWLLIHETKVLFNMEMSFESFIDPYPLGKSNDCSSASNNIMKDLDKIGLYFTTIKGN